jgi:hypothetical protein
MVKHEYKKQVCSQCITMYSPMPRTEWREVRGMKANLNFVYTPLFVLRDIIDFT